MWAWGSPVSNRNVQLSRALCTSCACGVVCLIARQLLTRAVLLIRLRRSPCLCSRVDVLSPTLRSHLRCPCTERKRSCSESYPDGCETRPHETKSSIVWRYEGTSASQPRSDRYEPHWVVFRRLFSPTRVHVSYFYRYGTIMRTEGCDGAGTTRIPRFSGPDVTYDGIEFGSSEEDNAGIIIDNMVRCGR